MNLFKLIAGHIEEAVRLLVREGGLGEEALSVPISVEPPREAGHGDITTNIAMVLAKPAGKKPGELAEKIATRLGAETIFENIEIAGPGFINMTLTGSFWGQILSAILEKRGEFGKSAVGENEKVIVEFVSVNPTGPLHVGHCRGAAYGDALANLLEAASFDVTREYYINDAGVQVDVLARSAYLRYLEALGENIGEIDEGLYPGDYLKPVGRELVKKYGEKLRGQPEDVWLADVRELAIEAMMDSIRQDLDKLSISFDNFFSERSLIQGDIDLVAKTIEELRGRGLVYEGRLPPPKGKLSEEWEDREQTLFRATQFGDDVDRALIKSDGSYTYFASDMAYHRDKFARSFKNMINVWGADHGGYVRRMTAAVKAMTAGEGTLDVKICQLVRLFRDGAPVKMSKRSGNFVTLRDVVDEVGSDPVRFMMLYRKNDAPLDFDFVKVQERSRDNPVFYVQYAHARAHSVLYRNLPDIFPDIDPDTITGDNVDIGLLEDEGEICLMKRLGQFPRLIETSALSHEPHRVAFYLFDLASDFHAQWNRGTDQPHLRFIRQSDRKLTEARMALVVSTADVIASGLRILGVNPVREMR